MPNPTSTTKPIFEKTTRLRAEQQKQDELLETLRSDGLAIITLASAVSNHKEKHKGLEQLLNELSALTEKLRTGLEIQIILAFALIDEATRLWNEIWEKALRDSTVDRAMEGEQLRWVLETAEQFLGQALRRLKEHAQMFEHPLARLNDLESMAAEFPLWVRECLSRWEMLDGTAPTLDPNRIARAHAAYARGDHEGVDDVLARVQAGGPWVKE